MYKSKYTFLKKFQLSDKNSQYNYNLFSENIGLLVTIVVKFVRRCSSVGWFRQGSLFLSYNFGFLHKGIEEC